MTTSSDAPGTGARMNLAVREAHALAEFLEWEERQELRTNSMASDPSAMSRRNGDATPTIQAQPRRSRSEAACAPSRAKFHGSDLKILAADE